jgi:hypothetical protein
MRIARCKGFNSLGASRLKTEAQPIPKRGVLVFKKSTNAGQDPSKAECTHVLHCWMPNMHPQPMFNRSA